MRIFFNHELLAAHPRLRKPESRSTVDDHLPLESITYKMQDPQWCLNRPNPSEAIATDGCKAFSVTKCPTFCTAQGVIGPRKKNGDVRLGSACKRALFFDNPKRRTVKRTLEQGLD
jgi:hypothetical protein